jgi:hypothetical protein
MAVTELFSKRQRKLRGEIPDVYIYDELPYPFRVQTVHILKDAFGEAHQPNYNKEVVDLYQHLSKRLCREYGSFELVDTLGHTERAVFQFILHEENIERVIDVIELSFKLINMYVRKHQSDFGMSTISPDAAIEELNIRFQEHGVGYQFESNTIIRTDSKVIHTEVVKPTLLLLSEKDYSGPQEEFLSAHEHYRQGRNKECLVDCLKSFESVMKIICTKRGWLFDPTDASKKLIKVLFDNNFIAPALQSEFDGLRALLESGVPTVRNKTPGASHGQGATVQDVPNHIASYALHLTATNILFLVECEKNLP